MGNSTRCISALNKAAGRDLSADELQEVFDSIKKTARDLASGKVKPAEGADISSPDGIVQHAAELASKELIAERVRQRRNVELQIKSIEKLQANVIAMRDAGVGEVDAVRRLIANDIDGRSNQFSLEARAQGVSNLLKSRIQSTWDAMGSDFLGLMQNREKVKNLLSEMLGVETGDKLAKDGARAWKETTDESLHWFNEKGGKIGHLDNWAFPQHHGQERVAAAGKEKWVADIYPRIDINRYTDLSGGRMPEPQIKELLAHAADSIMTNGANKIVPGEYHGNGGRSNRHAEERQIHFKDAESAIWYWENYGEKTVPDILLGHLEGMAKDIAFIEHFGPNPDSVYRTLRDQAEHDAKMRDSTKIDLVDKELARLDNLYDYAAGKAKPVASRAVAGMFDALRNLNSAGKLGSAFWASFYGDKVMLEAVSRLNNLPTLRNWANEVRLLNPFNGEERRLLQRQSLMLDYMQSAMYRFGDEMGRSSWAGKLSNAVMKVSGMSAINEWRRGAFGLSMMSAIGHEVSSRDWRTVGDQDMHILKTFGVDERDWRIWKIADLEDYGHGNSTMLTPEAIAKIPDARLKEAGIIAPDATPEAAAAVRRDAVVKYLGALHSESRNAVIEPGWSERAMMVGGLQRGNLRDEITRSFWQFKAFPITQFERMVDLGLSRPTMGGKAQFISTVILMQTIAGAMMLQTQSLLSGEDPRPMNDWKYWLAAAIKGGSLGIYGDFLYSQSGTTRYGSGPLEVLAGPTIGSAADTVTALVQAGNAIASGKETHLGAKLLNIGKGYIPFSNLWYTKAATDHIIFQNAQEMLSPGYLSNMRDRSRREFHQDWWWKPGETLPSRAPDFENAAGK